MASFFFGEIVEKSSRAFLDDDEDDIEADNAGKIIKKCEFAASWNEERSRSVHCDLFLLIEGPVAKAFFTQYVANGAEADGSVRRLSESEKTVGSRGGSEGSLYRLPCNITACVVNDVLDTEAVPFVESLAGLIASCSSVLCLVSVPLKRFCCALRPDDERMQEGFLRSLETNPAPSPLQITAPPLELPNLVAGVAAGAMTWCQRECVPARLVVCYSEESCGIIDSLTLAPLLPLLSCAPLSALPGVGGAAPRPPVPHDTAGNMYL